MVLDLHAEAGRSPALEAAIQPFQARRRERAMALVDHAVVRGELPPDVDREVAGDFLAAAVYWCVAVTGGSADRPYMERLAATLCAALKVDGEWPNGAP